MARSIQNNKITAMKIIHSLSSQFFYQIKMKTAYLVRLLKSYYTEHITT